MYRLAVHFLFALGDLHQSRVGVFQAWLDENENANVRLAQELVFAAFERGHRHVFNHAADWGVGEGQHPNRRENGRASYSTLLPHTLKEFWGARV
jgi:hypothetical protein